MPRAIKASVGTIRKVRQNQPRARTKATLYTVSQLLETYRDPRAILMEIAGMATEELMAKAECSYMDAIAERRLCAQAVLPYVVQKLPVQVDMRHTKAIHLNIVDDSQYTELQQLADSSNADVSITLIDQQPVDSTNTGDASQGVDERDGTGVAPPVAAPAEGDGH